MVVKGALDGNGHARRARQSTRQISPRNQGIEFKPAHVAIGFDFRKPRLIAVMNSVNALLLDDLSAMLFVVMTLTPVRQIFAVLLAVFVTVGLSLSVAQAGNMPMKMSMGSGMTTSGQGNFHDCDGGDAGKTKAMMCAAICAASAFATLPEVAPIGVAKIMTAMALPEDEFLIGSRSPPDPYPPRSSYIG
jgi:hypothetical protein